MQARIIYELILSKGYNGLTEMIGQQEEHSFLDFKVKNTNEKVGAENSDRATFAKAASGFSNAAGGVIIWGLDCRKGQDDKDVVQGLKPIPHVIKFVNDLNKYVPQAIQPLNSGIENSIIFEPNESEMGYVVTLIPESDLTPHRSLNDNLYYTRAGDNFIKVDHAMLSDMFGRRQRPKLEIEYRIEFISKRFYISLGIKNEGRYVATFPAIRLYKVSLPIAFSSPNHNSMTWTMTSAFAGDLSKASFNKGYIWTGGINDVIHPTTSKLITRLNKVMTLDELSNPDCIYFEVGYEIYAEGCQPVNGILQLRAALFLPFMNK